MKLEGRHALVTGATGGLGSAIARGLAESGASIAVHTRNADAATPLLGELTSMGRRAIVVTGDVCDPDAVAAMTATAEQQLGPIDILVNNAGVIGDAPFLELTPSEWERVIDTNLKGYFLVGQCVARAMAEQGYGRIINVSSTRQVQAWPGSAAYCASKGGIAMLTKVMAAELAPYGIRVNSIAPGTFLTDLNRHYLSDAEFRDRRIATIPAGRLGDPRDLVGAVTLLASDDADFLVGASIMIDGGQTLM